MHRTLYFIMIFFAVTLVMAQVFFYYDVFCHDTRHGTGIIRVLHS